MDAKQAIENVFGILCQIYVHDADVERMAQAKELLRFAYGKLGESESATDGS